MMHFPPVSNFPLFPKEFSDSVENFYNLTFSEKAFRFSFAKISYDHFSRRLQICNFPLFSQFQYISPYFRIFYFSSTFANFPPDFVKFMCFCFLIHSVFFISPWFGHDAFMHHTMHVLDASGGVTKHSTEHK